MFIFGILEALIQFILWLIEVFLGSRFLFQLFGANPAAPFVNWLYGTTDPLLNPFRNIFPASHIKAGLIIDFNILIAMVIYLIFGYIIMELIAVIRWSARGPIM